MTETGARGDEPESSWVGRLAIALLSILCIGVVATLVVPNVVRSLLTSSEAKAKVDVKAVCNAVENYAIENSGRYPESLEALVVPDPAGHTFLATDHVPVDPWKRPYGYEAPAADGSEFRVFSLGADGQPGGDGQDRDIDSLLIRREKD